MVEVAPEADVEQDRPEETEKQAAARAWRELEGERKEIHDRLLRALADFDNFKKRESRNRLEAEQRARDQVLVEMLAVLDNLERALAHVAPGEAESPLTEGMRLVLRQFTSVLERFGVRPVEAVGQPFDPQLHEAIQQVATDTHPPGVVALELRKGYLRDNKLLRPAMVAVARALPEASAAAEGADRPALELGMDSPQPDESGRATAAAAAGDEDRAG
jgi:molecular chaperone GrpE